MRLVTYYSHLNGLEFLLVHKPELWNEIKDVIEPVPRKRIPRPARAVISGRGAVASREPIDTGLPRRSLWGRVPLRFVVRVHGFRARPDGRPGMMTASAGR